VEVQVSIEGRPLKSANGPQAASLEQRVGAALTADPPMASVDLSALLTEVEVAIGAAANTAEQTRAKALNLLTTAAFRRA
jgi:hypothetical protein